MILVSNKTGANNDKVMKQKFTNVDGEKMDKIHNLVVTLWTLFISNLSFILVLLSLASFIYAGFLYNAIIGYIVLGLGLFLVAWLVQPTAEGR